MEKFLQILGRLIKVLWFLITIPLLCLAIVERVFVTQKENYGYYFSEDKIEESAYILREDLYNGKYCDIEGNKKECDNIKKESASHFISRLLDDPSSDIYRDLNSFFDGEISSKGFMNKVTSLYSWKYDLKYSNKSIALGVLYSFLLIIGYIIGTDLLIKIGGYIWNGKFSGGIDYKKLLKKIVK